MAMIGKIAMMERGNNENSQFANHELPITVITCTGDRPIQFSICSRIMNRMTVKPNQWIVVDDGVNPMPTDLIPKQCDYIRRVPSKDDCPMTLSLNMQEAFKRARNDFVIFIEDDDWYSAEYLKQCFEIGQGYDAIGALHRNYFQLQYNQYYSFINHREAITASTVLCNRKAIDGFKQTLNNHPDGNGLDTYFWVDNKYHTVLHRSEQATPVGIKAWGVGRGAGYKPSHTNNASGFLPDVNRDKLKAWIPDNELHWYSDNYINTKLSFVIFSPKYKDSSAGIRVLYKLNDMLNALGHKSRVTNNLNEVADKNDIVIYPEIVIGNPLQGNIVVRYLLNHPTRLGGNGKYGKDDILVTYDTRWLPYADNQLLIISVVEDFFYNENLERIIEKCVYVGKGKNTNAPCATGATMITANYPNNRQELAGLLKKTRVVYSYDDNTMLLTEAKMAGCKVLIINGDNITEYTDKINIIDTDKQLYSLIARCQLAIIKKGLL
jgi:hypothetical protein